MAIENIMCISTPSNCESIILVMVDSFANAPLIEAEIAGESPH